MPALCSRARLESLIIFISKSKILNCIFCCPDLRLSSLVYSLSRGGLQEHLHCSCIPIQTGPTCALCPHSTVVRWERERKKRHRLFAVIHLLTLSSRNPSAERENPTLNSLNNRENHIKRFLAMAPSKLVNFHRAMSARTGFLCLYSAFLSILTFSLETSFPNNDKMTVIIR